MEQQSILVVDDDDAFRTRLVRALADRGFEARGAASRAEARRLAAEDSPELAVVDLRVGEDNGLDVVRDLRAADPSTRIVVLTGFGSIVTALEAVRLGAVHYLTKPALVDQILAALGRPEEAPYTEGTGPTPTLARAEWEHIQRVLAECEGNITQAARSLGLHRRSLQRKLQKLPPRR